MLRQSGMLSAPLCQFLLVIHVYSIIDPSLVDTVETIFDEGRARVFISWPTSCAAKGKWSILPGSIPDKRWIRAASLLTAWLGFGARIGHLDSFRRLGRGLYSDAHHVSHHP